MSIDAMLVWSLIPGKSLIDVTSDGLLVSKRSRKLPFLIGKSISCSRLSLLIMSRKVSFNILGYW